MSWLHLLHRGLWRRPLRTLLTMVSLSTAFLLMGLLVPILQLFESRGEADGIDRLIVQPRHSITDILPISHTRAISDLLGVTGVSHQSWFGDTFRDEPSSFARWAVPAASFFELHPELHLTTEALNRFANTRTGVLVGQKTAEQFGLKVGDRITLIPDIWLNKEAKVWEFQVMGVFDSNEQSADLTAMYLNYEYFDEYRAWGSGLVSYINVGVGTAQAPFDVAAAIDARFDNSADETTTSSERDFALGFAEQLGDVGFMITLILGAVFFTIALVTANTVAQGMRERLGEFSVLRALGFQLRATQWLMMGEVLLLVALGASSGLLISSLLLEWGRDYFAQLGGIGMNSLTVAAYHSADAVHRPAGCGPTRKATAQTLHRRSTTQVLTLRKL